MKLLNLVYGPDPGGSNRPGRHGTRLPPALLCAGGYSRVPQGGDALSRYSSVLCFIRAHLPLFACLLASGRRRRQEACGATTAQTLQTHDVAGLQQARLVSNSL